MAYNSLKKILFITPFSPSANHAGMVYTRQLLSELSNRFIIDLVYFYYKGEKRFMHIDNVTVVQEVEINKKYKLLGLLSHLWVFPLFSSRYNKNVCNFLYKQVSAVKYDFVYFDFSQTFLYASFINHPNKILMSHDVMAQKYSRMKQYLRPWAMKTERKLLKEGVVFTFSEKDCRIIKEKYHINSIPTTFFLTKEVKEATPTIDNYFVFFGGWVREENYEALEWYIDNVNPLIPQIKYKVIGGGLPDRIKRKLNLLKNFDYLGFVGNPYPIIAASMAEIAPLRKGAGVKVKCIDALGCGTPVIGTDIAFEGIPSEFGDFMIQAETSEEYAAAISNLNFSIEERIKFKYNFIKKYDDKNILKYLYGECCADKL